MAAEMRGLGRGLDALLGGSSGERESNQSEVLQLPLSSIVPNKFQPRSEFDENGLTDLTASIKSQGVLQPILVRPLSAGKYELVAGERRTRASKLAGLREIPALVREMSDEQSLAIALIENLQREDLNSIEEAKGYKQLIEQFGLSQEKMAEQVGKSRSAIANALRLLKLPESVQRHISGGTLSAGHGRALMALEDAGAIGQLAKRVLKLGLSVRQAEAEAAYYNDHSSFPETGMTSSGTTGSGPARKSVAIDEKLISMKSDLEQAYGVPVRVTGSAAKGKITFSFVGEEQRQELMDQLSVKS